MFDEIPQGASGARYVTSLQEGRLDAIRNAKQAWGKTGIGLLRVRLPQSARLSHEVDTTVALVDPEDLAILRKIGGKKGWRLSVSGGQSTNVPNTLTRRDRLIQTPYAMTDIKIGGERKTVYLHRMIMALRAVRQQKVTQGGIKGQVDPTVLTQEMPLTETDVDKALKLVVSEEGLGKGLVVGHGNGNGLDCRNVNLSLITIRINNLSNNRVPLRQVTDPRLAIFAARFPDIAIYMNEEKGRWCYRAFNCSVPWCPIPTKDLVQEGVMDRRTAKRRCDNISLGLWAKNLGHLYLPLYDETRRQPLLNQQGKQSPGKPIKLTAQGVPDPADKNNTNPFVGMRMPFPGIYTAEKFTECVIRGEMWEEMRLKLGPVDPSQLEPTDGMQQTEFPLATEQVDESKLHALTVEDVLAV